jgi:hypothetical protein
MKLTKLMNKKKTQTRYQNSSFQKMWSAGRALASRPDQEEEQQMEWPGPGSIN